jgi:hypothetical protein
MSPCGPLLPATAVAAIFLHPGQVQADIIPQGLQFLTANAGAITVPETRFRFLNISAIKSFSF